MRGAETIELVRLGTPDRYGERPELPPVVVDECIIWPHTATPDVGEDNLRGVFVIAGINVWIPAASLPAGMRVLATDRFRARGEYYEVDGEPGEYKNAGGRDVGVMVVCKKVGVPVAS